MANGSGPKNNSWKGGRHINTLGYVMVMMPTHPRADKRGYVYEHILIAEKALGKPLPPGAIVHHHNPIQLVIGQNQSYHMLLHQRMRAFKDCGHASWRKCQFCQKYDDVGKMIPNGVNCFAHGSCKSESNKAYKKAYKERLCQKKINNS